MSTFIYTLTDPRNNEIRYVGKTSTSLSKRLNSHVFYSKNNPKTYCQKWINSLLKEGIKPTIETLYECKEETQEFWEKYWIQQIKAWGFRLTNLTKGGERGSGYRWTPEQKQRQSKRMLSARGKEVNQYSLEGTYIQTFLAVGLAAEIVNKQTGNITWACKDVNRICGGYRWSFDKVEVLPPLYESHPYRGDTPTLLGSKVGKLTVLERDIINNKNRAYWLCRCDCGRVKSIRQSSLTKASPVLSCGCTCGQKKKSV